MVFRLCDYGVQGRDGRCVENSSCFQIVLFVPVCILLLGSPAGLIVHFLVLRLGKAVGEFFKAKQVYTHGKGHWARDSTVSQMIRSACQFVWQLCCALLILHIYI